MIGLYVAVRTFIAWLWLRFCRWCAQPLRLVLKSNEYYHKIVIIGDGFAAGFGDWITMASSGGLSEYIAHEISKEDKTPSISPDQTLRNIQAICDALRKKGKRVCVGSLCHSDVVTECEGHRSINQALVDFCASTATDAFPVKITPDLSTPVVRRSDAKAFDGFHFNAKAYQQIARDSMMVLTPLLTAVEWSTWKKQLDGVKYDAALYD
ncbi:hypothetical protein DYB34_008482 [Aphanomyces astaci]|uniref:SGNH hydrolase-type esterase domain-containing protein n=1 Tax=Aphanomyces astaci TaxID=112090 RepID=A0A3R7ACC1_APHAT|nr:hypothetical protein DYB34_008482 [Aphanomyces astaci]